MKFLLHPFFLLVFLAVGCVVVFDMGGCGSDFTAVDEYCVANDYYKVAGVVTPLNGDEIEELLDDTGMELPSVALVDAIWKAAEFIHTPRTMDYRADYRLHQIEKAPPDLLQAGHKKDVVLLKGGRVCIYGWHRPDGVPIQPFSCVHHRDYKDYSHGVRLVYRR
jgi:hypothetical protein